MARRRPSAAERNRPPTILIVEDEILLRAAIADYLRECGFKVHEAGNGADALAILRARKMTIDLVLSDIEMPGECDGFALAQWIRKNKPKLPIVLAGSDELKSKAANNLCETTPFVSKPYDLRRVVVFVRNAIQAQDGKRR